MPKVNFFALGASGISPEHPFEFNVNIDLLTLPFADAVNEAVANGAMPSYQCAPFGSSWVRRADLVALVGPSRNIDDPRSDCYVPRDALLKIPYLPD